MILHTSNEKVSAKIKRLLQIPCLNHVSSQKEGFTSNVWEKHLK